MIETLYTSSSTACFEIKNNSPYYAPEAYEVRIGGTEVLKGDTNIFSLFDLIPDTAYEAEVCFADRTESVSFRTAAENCCIDVRSFGAYGDGMHDDTAAIQTAINLLPENARLYFPNGTYLTFPLSLRSHMTLEFAKDAVLLGSTEREKYQILPGTVTDRDGKDIPFAGFEGIEQACYQSLIQGSYVEDVRIIGQGRIDGNADKGDWWKDFSSFPAKRPRAVFLNRCKDITLHGVTVANSASWHIHPYFSENISILDCFITAPKVSPNTDAIDPESCDGVDIIGCRFSVGDDCIAVKSGKFDMAMKYHVPADHHTVRNCLMEFGHGAMTLGSELSAGIRNLSVTQCLFRQTDRGLRIKSRRGRGRESIITNVIFDNIRMEQVKTPIVINMWYNCVDPDRYSEYVWCREPLPVDERTPHMGLFEFKNMECIDAEAAACYIDGLPESRIDRVVFENISVSFAENAKPFVPAMQNFAEERCRLGLYINNVHEISLKNVRVEGALGEKVIADNYDKISNEGERSFNYKRIDDYVLKLVEDSTPSKTMWNLEKIREGKDGTWNYIDGCMLTALLEMTRITGDPRYASFVETVADYYVQPDGSILTLEPDKANLDDINEGRMLFELFEKTGKEKYRLAAGRLYSQLEAQPRTEEGNFWHKAIYPNQVWLDGIYMAQPFRALYEKYFGNGDYSDIVRQIRTVHDRMLSSETGLYFHGYDASRSVFWADPETGCSENYWLRSLGWFAVALADLSEILPESDEKDELVKIFADLMQSISRYTDEETGMYWQVVDQPAREGNYLETSGSAMMAYAMLKGSRLGILPEEFALSGEKTFRGIIDRYLTFTDTGINLGGICLVAGLGPENNRRRDGTYEYYISEPVVENDAKGVAPFVLAYTEFKRRESALRK